MSEDFDADVALSELLTRAEPTKEWYHYTTITGLKGILDKAQLWGTQVAYLNDSQEIEYGVEALAQLVRAHSNQLPLFEQNADRSYRYFPKNSLWIGTDQTILDRKAELKQELGPFVACLSRARDLLSQWRGYGQGGGYAIRFDPEVLSDTLEQVDSDGDFVEGAPPVNVASVKYNGHSFEAQIISVVERYHFEVTSLVATPDMTEDEAAALHLEPERRMFDKVLQLATRMKHPKFQEEWETRIMCRCDETFYTESQTLGLIPRTSFWFSPHAIREIIIGPSSFADSRKLSVERYLAKDPVRFHNVEVTVSEIPYREL